MVRLIFVTLLLFAVPSWAFVEKLHPNLRDGDGGGIPCHAMGAILRSFIAPGGPNAGILGNIIEREWVPGGWSAQDTADNSALISGLNGMSQADKQEAVERIEDYCILWELNVDELNSPAEYRSRLGLPPAS